ncbi:MAG: Crp/Fnr family transcriptional regulator [Pseudomonadota bacterium]|nr:Crp/Fnr family transcriptional regulator [Pseudomonadota bacterium]
MPKGIEKAAGRPQTGIAELVQRHAELRSLIGPEWEAALSDSTVFRSASGPTRGLERGVGAGSHFGIVLKGTIRVRSLSVDGRMLGICRVQPGEMCMQSLTAIYSSEQVLVDLAAEGDVVALQIPAFHLPLLLARCEAFRAYLMSSMSKHVTTLLGRIEDTTFGCLKTRILAHLRDRRDATGCSAIAVSHQELAEELGNTREAVSRALKQMEKSGILVLGRRSISLLDGSPAATLPADSQPAPRRDFAGAMETHRLRESFAPAPPQKRPDLRSFAPPARPRSAGPAGRASPGATADRTRRSPRLVPPLKPAGKMS